MKRPVAANDNWAKDLDREERRRIRKGLGLVVLGVDVVWHDFTTFAADNGWIDHWLMEDRDAAKSAISALLKVMTSEPDSTRGREALKHVVGMVRGEIDAIRQGRNADVEVAAEQTGRRAARKRRGTP